MAPLDPQDWLPSHADYIRERAEAENEHGIRWTDAFSEVVRRKLGTVYDDLVGTPGLEDFAAQLDASCLALLRRHSRIELQADRLDEAMTEAHVDDAEVADWLAVVPLGIPAIFADWYPQGMAEDDYAPGLLLDATPFYEAVNDVLLEERVGWLYLHNRFRRREEQPLHLDVIQPIEALLSEDPRFVAAERTYGEAINHLAQGNFGSAVSLAYSATQETFHALGVKGNDLGQLLASAKGNGFLVGADTQLVSAIKGLAGWLTANRSERGNAHGASSAQKPDAQLAIHVAASLMLRLMQFPEPEGEAAPGA